MSEIQQINLGTLPKGLDGDTQRTANLKTNDNMKELDKRTQENKKTADAAFSKAGGVITGETRIKNKLFVEDEQMKVLSHSGAIAIVAANTDDWDSPVDGQFRYSATIRTENTNFGKGEAFEMWVEDNSHKFCQGVLHLFNWIGDNFYWSFRDDGNAYALGGSWINSSDRRMKTNIVPVFDALSLLKDIGTYTYLKNGQKGIGYISQELQANFPQAVWEIGDITLENGMRIENALGVDYGAMTAINTKAINQLHDLISAQTEMITELTKRLEALENK